jgi:hypothetical protein
VTEDIEDDRPLAVQRAEQARVHGFEELARIKQQAAEAAERFHERYDRRKDTK